MAEELRSTETLLGGEVAATMKTLKVYFIFSFLMAAGADPLTITVAVIISFSQLSPGITGRENEEF